MTEVETSFHGVRGMVATLEKQRRASEQVMKSVVDDVAAAVRQEKMLETSMAAHRESMFKALARSEEESRRRFQGLRETIEVVGNAK